MAISLFVSRQSVFATDFDFRGDFDVWQESIWEQIRDSYGHIDNAAAPSVDRNPVKQFTESNQRSDQCLAITSRAWQSQLAPAATSPAYLSLHPTSSNAYDASEQGLHFGQFPSSQMHDHRQRRDGNLEGLVQLLESLIKPYRLNGDTLLFQITDNQRPYFIQLLAQHDQPAFLVAVQAAQFRLIQKLRLTFVPKCVIGVLDPPLEDESLPQMPTRTGIQANHSNITAQVAKDQDKQNLSESKHEQDVNIIDQIINEIIRQKLLFMRNDSVAVFRPGAKDYIEKHFYSAESAVIKIAIAMAKEIFIASRSDANWMQHHAFADQTSF